MQTDRRVMGRDNNVMKPLIFGAVVFLTLGVSIANETLARFGLEDNYVMLFSLALLLAVLLLSRNILILGLVLGGVILMNMPDATLATYRLDRDVLVAAVCAIILAPSVYNIVFR